MSSQTRLTRAYNEALRITFNNSDKFILFSDCVIVEMEVLPTILPTIVTFICTL